ncbi:MAG: hypothetical protein FWD60_04385 [Candidatus Azobacteroides sp.]|nr:hypothetical protein [Candidatus Azobacteroides sp.]
MAQAIVTPQDLRDFATILQKNIEEFTTIENSMNQKLNSYDWKDAVALKFKADFEATKEPLNKLRQQMEVFMPYLTKKADTLEGEYLGNNTGGSNLETSAIIGGAAVVGGATAAGIKSGITATSNSTTNKSGITDTGKVSYQTGNTKVEFGATGQDGQSGSKSSTFTGSGTVKNTIGNNEQTFTGTGALSAKGNKDTLEYTANATSKQSFGNSSSVEGGGSVTTDNKGNIEKATGHVQGTYKGTTATFSGTHTSGSGNSYTANVKEQLENSTLEASVTKSAKDTSGFVKGTLNVGKGGANVFAEGDHDFTNNSNTFKAGANIPFLGKNPASKSPKIPQNIGDIEEIVEPGRILFKSKGN